MGVAVIAGALGAREPARAQTAEVPFHIETYALASGAHDGAGGEVARPFRREIRIAGAQWLQIIFASHELGRGSWVSIRSLRDGDVQTLDARSMPEWRSHSGYFNGDTVEIALHVAPGDSGVFVAIDRVVVGEPARVPVVLPESGGAAKDICGGADNRVAWNDNRIGCVMPIACTAWRVTNGAFLTAGHCVDIDPDGGGPMLPDGVLDTLTVVQFNVPPSDSNGTIVNPPIADQFPVNNSTVQWRFDGAGQGLGKDYAVFKVGANTNGLLAHEVYGFPFRVTRETPAAGTTMRVTGFGVDSLPSGTPGPYNAQSQTNQTMTGTTSARRRAARTSGFNMPSTRREETPGVRSSGNRTAWRSAFTRTAAASAAAVTRERRSRSTRSKRRFETSPARARVSSTRATRCRSSKTAPSFAPTTRSSKGPITCRSAESSPSSREPIPSAPAASSTS